jgi:hypothetical protein
MSDANTAGDNDTADSSNGKACAEPRYRQRHGGRPKWDPDKEAADDLRHEHDCRHDQRVKVFQGRHIAHAP